MTVAQYVVLERDAANFDNEMNGSALGASGVKLDKIAKELGVTPLMEFFSPDVEEVLGMLEDAGMALDELPDPLPEEKWFSASEGLNTVRRLVEWVANSRGQIRGKRGVLADLARMEEILDCAEKEGLRWHLGIDI